MNSYFKPLRRRIGLVTLVMASVLMVAWVRSVYVKDEILFQRRGSEGKIISLRGTMAWGTMGPVYGEMSKEDQQLFRKELDRRVWAYEGWLSSPITAEESSYPVFFQWLDWLGGENPEGENSSKQGTSWELFNGKLVDYGFAFFQQHISPFEKVEVWIIPYGSIVIPLTLLSAWLLLRKPRAPKQPCLQQRA